MNINYHVHTPLCNHATGSMSEYIRHAVGLGMAEICFLDHLTLNPADKGLSMALKEVPLYYQSARQLAFHYRDELTVKVGLEIDFHPDFTPLIQSLVGQFDFDVVGSSVHFLGDEDIVSRQCDWGHGRGDPLRVYRQYFETLSRMLDHDYFDVICHFDLPKKFGRRPPGGIETELDRILMKIKTKGLSVEVNTSGYAHRVQEAYPSLDILKKCRQLDVPITLGSDAHRPDQLNRHYEKTADLLRAAGYTHLRTFTRRRPGSMPITGKP